MIGLTERIRVLALGGDESLTYSLRLTSRVRTVGIFVEPDGQVAVLAPESTALQRVEQIMHRRMKWIRRKQQAAESLPVRPLPREWVAGETHRYLGRQYRLKLAEAGPSSVRLVGGYFLVTLPDAKDRNRVRHLMERWYKEHATALLNDRVRRMLASSTWLRMEPPAVRVQQLKTRWGSTTAARRVTFNIDLVKLSLSCVDYVVAHELVHLMIPSHSPAFWRMLGRVMPDWRRWQSKLASVEV